MSAPQPPVPPPSYPTAYPTAPSPGYPPQPTAPAVTPHAGPFAPPAVAPVHPQYGATLAPAPVRRSAALGIIAVVAAGLAAVTPLSAAVAAFQIGLGTGKTIASRPLGDDFDLGILTPVRDWVLMGEVSFWVGTALGVWALAQGIIAWVKRAGRVAGIVATIIAVVAPVVFWVAVWISLTAGLSAGGSVGG